MRLYHPKLDRHHTVRSPRLAAIYGRSGWQTDTDTEPAPEPEPEPADDGPDPDAYPTI